MDLDRFRKRPKLESHYQDDIRDGESRWLRSLDVAHMISFDVDVRTGKVSRKGALCDMLGVGPHGSRENFLRRVHPDDRVRLKSAREQCTADSPSYTVTYRFEKNDGSECWLREDADATFDSSGHKSHIIGTCRDVTVEQEARRDSEKQRRQLKAITDATPAMIAYVDTDQRYQFVNATYATQFGRSIDEIIGETVSDVVGKASYQQIQPQLEAALDGEKRVYELVIDKATSKNQIFKEVTYVPDINSDGAVDGCNVLVVDITQQKQDANTAIARKSQLQLALQTARMGVLEWDAMQDRVTWSDSLHEIFGYAPGEIEATRDGLLSIVHPADRAMLQSRMASAMYGCEEFSVEYRVICGNAGTVIWTYGIGSLQRDDQGRLQRMTSVVQDVTAKKTSEQKLAQNKHRLQQVVDGASVGIAFVKATGQLVTANDAALRMLGVSRTQFDREGYDWTNSIRHEDRPKANTIVDELKASGRMRPQEILLSHTGGKLQPVQISSISVSAEDDEHVVFLVDLSEQKRYEQSIEEARRSAEAANTTKSEFLANMSHEIRTPMSAIIGYLDILARNLTEPDDLKCVSIIRHNSRFLLEIINDILDISKIEAGKLALQKKRFRPEKLLADVRSLMQVRAAEKGLELNFECDGKIPKTIRSDDKRLKQILVNLIGNAIKFTEEGSVDLRVRFIQAEQLLAFDIVDTGIGIEPKLLAKLFQPFTQGDTSLNREFGGTGLGLTISQRLANLLGGEILAESELGDGSVFSLRIAVGSLNNVPMTAPNLSIRIAEPKPKSDVKLPRLSGKILVVDDRRDIRHIAKHILEDVGASVSEAEDGKQAINCIRQAELAEDEFDLIVMDMQMPVMDGYAATRQLRASGFDKPIVALTAHAMRGDRKKCIDAGCSDYLTKPLDRRQFVNLLASRISATKNGGTTESRRILIVEDLVEAADSLAMLLEFKDYVVEKAYDGATAVELAENFRPEVVLLDLGLPDMSGYDVLNAIKRLRPTTHFIALTGRENQEETHRAGFAHHIVKPVDIDKVEAIIASLASCS